MLNELIQGDLSATPVDYRLVALSLFLAFLCGHLMAWIYTLTHSGMSYSRSFVKALVVMPVIVAFTLLILSSSLVTAFGLMAVLAIVRFRNVLRDTLDTSYLLAAIVLGMAAGTQRYTTTLIGCAVLCSIFVYLWLTSFGTRQHYDFILNLNWTRPLAELADLSKLLERHTMSAIPASQHSSRMGGVDLSYRLLMRDPERVEEMIHELSELAGVQRIQSIAAENESEI